MVNKLVPTPVGLVLEVVCPEYAATILAPKHFYCRVHFTVLYNFHQKLLLRRTLVVVSRVPGRGNGSAPLHRAHDLRAPGPLKAMNIHRVAAVSHVLNIALSLASLKYAVTFAANEADSSIRWYCPLLYDSHIYTESSLEYGRPPMGDMGSPLASLVTVENRPHSGQVAPRSDFSSSKCIRPGSARKSIWQFRQEHLTVSSLLLWVIHHTNSVAYRACAYFHCCWELLARVQ